MNTSAIVFGRMGSQGLTGGRFADPAAVVGWMGCVQAQDFGMAKWGIGVRLAGVSDAAVSAAAISEAAVEAAFNAGSILRTHVLRPTWHFVLPADIGWLVKLSAPRIRGLCKPYHRQLEIDAPLLRRSRKIITKALEDGAFLTRVEIAALLKKAKIETSDIRMTYLMLDAELEGLICSGDRRGKQFTYASMSSRVAHSPDLSGDEALGELARRFFLSRGPATVNDLAWWGGLTVADAKTGLAVVKSSLECAVVEGKEYWFAGSLATIAPKVLLLPAYDELTVGYGDREAILSPAYEKASFHGLRPVIVVNGRIVGIWRRLLSKGTVVIETQFFEKVSKTVLDVVHREARRYGKFLCVPALVQPAGN